jgi:hypothetical protein
VLGLRCAALERLRLYDSDPHSDAIIRQQNTQPLLDSARRERARRWARTELKGYPTLSAEDETEATLAAAPTESQLKKGKIDKE